MEFDMPKDQSSIIKVIGVGGGGSNAVNHMYNQGIDGVDFIVCNTDRQALDISPVPFKIQLGPSLTEGRGAGSIPEIGMNAAIENIDDIKELLGKNAKMVFVTAGMGGGTGTGAAPVIAKVARELGVLTVGIVTVPFNFEGRKRRQQAEEGLENMRESVDTLLVINNERLREISGNLTLGNAFAQADNVLTTAAKGIADVISVTGAINVDFNDVNTVMKNRGVAIMGSAVAEGDERATEAVQQALSSPLLNDNDISGAEYVLLNITYGSKEVLMDEISDITDYIQEEAGSTADVIWGHGYDETLGDSLSVTIIATGFDHSPVTGFEKAPEKKVQVLEEEKKNEIKERLDNATSSNVYKEAAPEKKEPEPYIKTDESPENTEESGQGESEMNGEIKTVEPSANENESEDTTDDHSNDEEVKRYFLDDDMGNETSFDGKPVANELTQEEQQKRAQDRLHRIRDYTSQLKSAEGLSELEKEPAFKRRKIDLGEEPDSSKTNISRFEVSDREENNTSLRGSNSFLHDNVD
jgi:cell division protein FtsZ